MPRTVGPNFFKTLNDDARRAFALSRKVAVTLSHDFIDTEHLLLAIIEDEKFPAVQALRNLGIDPTALADAVRKRIGGSPCDALTAGQIPFAPNVMEVLVSAETRWTERLRSTLVHAPITERDLLLALWDQSTGVAAQALAAAGISRETLLRVVSDASE